MSEVSYLFAVFAVFCVIASLGVISVTCSSMSSIFVNFSGTLLLSFVLHLRVALESVHSVKVETIIKQVAPRLDSLR